MYSIIFMFFLLITSALNAKACPKPQGEAQKLRNQARAIRVAANRNNRIEIISQQEPVKKLIITCPRGTNLKVFIDAIEQKDDDIYTFEVINNNLVQVEYWATESFLSYRLEEGCVVDVQDQL
jgi:hypothetical protein